jgi:response regulator of citrate/malate metabolism
VADKTHLQVDLGVIQEVGQRAAVVLAIISDGCDKEGTTSMTHAGVARRAGIAHISARRAINKLRNVGLLKSEPRYQDNWQRANCTGC